MRGASICVLALVLGCNHDDAPGALIEVTSAVPATHFELLYSNGACNGCDHLTTPSQLTVVGTGWLSKDLQRFDYKFEGPTDQVLLQLQTDDPALQHVERAVIVALADVQNGTNAASVVAVATFGPFEIPIGDSVKFKVRLEPADALNSQTDKEHVELWRRSNDPDVHTACVAVKHPKDAEFFVPADDPDCDDPRSGAVECDDFSYMASGPPPLDKANCTAHGVQGIDCRLGGPPCVEGSTAPPPGSCVPVQPAYCLPQYMCGLSCTNTLDRSCLGMFVSAAPMAVCEVYTQAGRPCPNATAANVSFASLVFDTNGKCKKIQIAAITPPLVFGDTVTVGDSVDAMFTLSNFQEDPCSVQVSWTGAFSADTTILVKVVSDSGVNRVVAWHLLQKGTQCPTVDVPPLQCYAEQGSTTDGLYRCPYP